MKRVAIYLRLSLEDDVNRDESNSISNQRSMLRKHLRTVPELRDMEIVEFKDDGYSGKNMERPGVQAMLEMVKRGGIAAILVKDISRYSRDYLEAGRYLEQIFPFMGVRFIAVNDNYDSANFSGGIAEIDVAFKEILYDYYSEDLSMKVRTAKMTAALNGKYVSSQAPYGYRRLPNDRHKVEIDEVSGGVVREIFRMAGEGMSFHKIARDLNDRGIESPSMYNMRVSGKGCRKKHDHVVWYPSVIRRILMDEFFMGTYVFRKTEIKEVGKKKRILHDSDEWVRIPEHHEALIPEAEFRAVQEALDKRSTKGRTVTKRTAHVLVGKVVCGCCGANMTHSWGGKKEGRPFYCCFRAYHGKGGSHERNAVKDEVMERCILTEIEKEAGRYADTEAVRAEGKAEHNKRLSDAEKKLKGLEDSLERIYEEQKEDYEAFRMGRISREDFLGQKGLREAEEADAVRRIEEQRKVVADIEALDDVDGDVFDGITIGKGGIAFERLTKEIVERFLDKVTVWPGGRMEIGWRFKGLTG